MEFMLTSIGRAVLQEAMRQTRQIAQWQRYQTVWLVGMGQEPAEAAQAVGVCRASVYSWTKAWRERGLAGITLRPHQTRPRLVDEAGEIVLRALLRTDPQTLGYVSPGWTVPLLREEAAKAGYSVGDRTLRRALHRLGWRWKRPKYVLGRPDPAYEKKKRP